MMNGDAKVERSGLFENLDMLLLWWGLFLDYECLVRLYPFLFVFFGAVPPNGDGILLGQGIAPL